MGWGILNVGRIQLSERYTLEENHNAGTREKTIALHGQHYTGWRGIGSSGVERMQEDVLGLADRIVPVTFQHKTDQSGYYQVHDVNVSRLSWPSQSMVSFEWSFILHKYGPDNVVDLESRLGTVVRSNNFALVGERWQAPSIGHYGYFVGSSGISGTVTRVNSDGVGVVIYRGVPANISPRWGCPVGSYAGGRAKLLTGGVERVGTSLRASPTDWELNNGLMRITPLGAGAGCVLRIEGWDGGAWSTNDFDVTVGTEIAPPFDAITVLRNDFECVTIRLTKSKATSGRSLVDLTLRRGAMFVEGFTQTDSAATLGVSTNSVMVTTNNAANGYIEQTSNDAQGNKMTLGSPLTFTGSTTGGMTKAAVTGLPWYVGYVIDGSGAVSGNTAVDLRNQYIGALSETTMVVKR